MRGRLAVKVLNGRGVSERRGATLRAALLALRRRRSVLQKAAAQVQARIKRVLRATRPEDDDLFMSVARERWGS